MQASNVTNLLFQQLNFRGEREKVISSNIANLDTPNYKTKDLKFKNELDKSKQESQLQLTRTNRAHLPLMDSSKQNSMELYEVQGLEEQNDGNNVNLDSQMSNMSQNSIMFSALQNSIKKDSMWFKTVIDSSSKN